MPLADKIPFPETFTITDPAMVSFIENAARPFPSTEWREIATYKLVRVQRVRYVAEWEDDGAKNSK